MFRMFSIAVFTLCLSVCLGIAACSGGEPVTLRTGPPAVTAGIRFEGATVPFWGKVPEGCQVVVKASGPIANQSVRPRDGLRHILSPSVVCGLPSLYQILISTPMQAISDDLKREIGIDTEYGALRADARVFNVDAGEDSGVPGGLAELRTRQAVRQLVSKHLYAHFEDAVEVQGDNYSGELYIPAGGPLKDIHLTAYAIKDGRIAGTAGASLDLPREFFTRPFGETPDERALYLAIMVLSIVIFTLTGMELVQKIRAGSAARK